MGRVSPKSNSRIVYYGPSAPDAQVLVLEDGGTPKKLLYAILGAY